MNSLWAQGSPSPQALLIIFKVILGSDRIARARTGNRKSQHRVPDPAWKPPESAWPPPPPCTDLLQEATAEACSSWTSSMLLSSQQTTQSPASRNFPKMAAKPFVVLTLPPPGAHQAMLGTGALRRPTPPPPQPGPLLSRPWPSLRPHPA